MKSKTSCFNCGIFKSMLRRFWPMWAAYFGILFVALPLPTMIESSRLGRAEKITNLYGNCSAFFSYTGILIAFFAAIFVAMAMYSFMYSSRTSSMIASLPVKRAGVFCSAYLAGLLPILASNLIICLLTFSASLGSNNAIAFKLLMQMFAVLSIYFMIFYGIAVFTANITANLVTLPILYTVFNCIAYAFEIMISSFINVFLWGAQIGSMGSRFSFLSPLIYMLENLSESFDYDMSTPLVIGSFEYSGWRTILIYLAASAALSVISLFLYRSHKMETAGDVVSVPILRPIAKYCVTICCAVAGGLLLYAIFSSNQNCSGAFTDVICSIGMVLGALVGYFGSEMLLNKTLHVWHGHWVGFIITAVLCIVFVLCCSIDVLSFESYVPAADEIESVTIDSYSLTFTDEQSIKAVTEIHQGIIENREKYDESINPDGTVFLNMRYTLKDGSSLSRSYCIDYRLCDKDENLEAIDELLHSDKAILARVSTPFEVSHDSVTYSDISIFINYSYDYGYDDTNCYQLTPAQAADFYNNAIMTDAANGVFAYSAYDDGCADNGETYIYFNMELVRPGTEGIYDNDYYYFSLDISSNATACIAWIEANLGLDFSGTADNAA